MKKRERIKYITFYKPYGIHFSTLATHQVQSGHLNTGPVSATPRVVSRVSG
jgi:hypothetical protein